jgi:hypothetical protein
VTAAIFSLIGVVVGVCANTGANLLLERSGKKRKARALTRLVRVELGLALAFLSGLIEDANTGQEVEISEHDLDTYLRTDAWSRHQDAIAEHVSRDDWVSLAAAYMSVELLRRKWRHIEPKQERLALLVETQKSVAGAGAAVFRAEVANA